MKVVVPIRSYEQAQLFLNCGADEFYCGVIFDEWMEKYGSFIEYNRRGNFHLQANFPSIYELGKAIDIIRNSKKDIYLTVNAICIFEDQLPILDNLIKTVKKIGISGVIISDPILIPLCNKHKISFIISSCSNVINAECVKMYYEWGASRIIYPRSIQFDDMKLISSQIKNIDFEAFLMNSACKFTDGNCIGTHNTKYESLCSYIDKYPKKYQGYLGKSIDDHTMQKILNNAFFYKQLFSNAKGIGCAQCEIYRLMQFVKSVKIVGRLLSTEELCNQILLTKKNIDIAANCSSEKEYRELMIYPDNSILSGICKNRMSCYYR